MHLGNGYNSLTRLILSSIHENKIYARIYSRIAVYFERFSIVRRHSPKASVLTICWLQRIRTRKNSVSTYSSLKLRGWQKRSFLRIWSHLLKKLLIENLIFSALRENNFNMLPENITCAFKNKASFMKLEIKSECSYYFEVRTRNRDVVNSLIT